MHFYPALPRNHLVAAHRGYRSIRPENTLAAFAAAMGRFDFIELDIQPSRDGVLMVFHDDSLERTTDIHRHTSAPRPHYLGEYDYPFLRTLDAGSWFAEDDPFGTWTSQGIALSDIASQAIPTLDEVLALCDQHTMPLNIEIKDSPCTDPETLLIDLLKAIAPYRDRIPMLISSFNHRYLARLNELDATLALAANVEHTHPPQLLVYLHDLGVCAYHVDAPLIESTPVEALQTHGIVCGAFTVNDQAVQKACHQKGFRAIFSDTLAQTP